MRTIPSRSILAVLGALTLVGCSELYGVRVKGVSRRAVKNAGIPYMLSRPSFAIQVRALKGGKAASPVHEVEIGSAADPTQRFEVCLDNGWFVRDELSVNLEDDGRLSSVGAVSADKTAKIIGGLGELAASILGVAGLSREDDFQALLEEWQKTHAAFTDADIRLLVKSQRFLDGLQGQPTGFVGVAAKVTTLLVHVAKAAKLAAQGFHADPTEDKKLALVNAYGLLELLRDLQQLISQQSAAPASKSPRQRVADAMSVLRKKVEETLADYVETSNKGPLDAAVLAYKAALKRVLYGHRKFDGRNLKRERKVIADFLKTAIPGRPRAGHGATYEAVVKQMAALDAAIAKLITVTPAARKVLPVASDIVRRIESPHTMPVARSVDRDGFKKEILAAKALVEFELQEGVVLHQPLRRSSR